MRLSGEPDPSPGTSEAESDGGQPEPSKHHPVTETASNRDGSTKIEVTKLLRGSLIAENDLKTTEAQHLSRKQPDESVAVTDIAAIHRHMGAGNLEQAALRANLALVSFPGHPELTKLESKIHERIKHDDQFRRLISEAEQYRKSRQWELAIERYEAARGLDPENKLARVHMARAYAGWAQDVLPVDKQKAGKLMELSLGLDADNHEVRRVQLALLQEITKELVDRALTKARELRARGELVGAERELRNALQELPGDPALSTYLSELSATSKQDRHVVPNMPDIEETQDASVLAPENHIQEGQILAERYEILTHLGTGGMSSVYKARDLLVDETIALKIVLPFISRQPRLREKFKQELLVARRLTHPNVIRIYDIGEQLDLLFISMELIEGQTVADRLIEQKRFTVDQFLTLFNQFTSALSYIHSQQVLHRDIKPQNLMYDKDGNLKVMDFGIARDMASEETTTSIALGTPGYMSPELLEGAVITPASDIYSSGAMFYELLTGTKLFANASLHERLKSRVPRVSELVPDIPRDLDEMVFRCLQIRPEDRFQSVAELVSAISDNHRSRSESQSGTLADLIRDDPASLLDVLPIFVRTVQQLNQTNQDSSTRAILTPKTIQWTPTDVRIKTVSAVEAHHTRAVDCKYVSFEDFSEVTPTGPPRLESDIYVLGFIFYEILLGQRLFKTQFGDLYKGDWNFQWLNWHSDATKKAPPLKQILSDIPPVLSDTIDSMMRKAMEHRPDLATVEASLKSVLENLKREVMKTVIVKWKPRVAEKTTSPKGVFIATILLLAFLALAVAWFLRGGS